MKNATLALLLGLALRSFAQPVITSSTFPAAGDKLHYATDLNPTGTDFPGTAPGGNQTWNFSAAAADEKSERHFQPASAGSNSASFPGAELVVKDALRETYFNVTGPKLENLGFAGKDPFGLNLDMTGQLQPPVVEKRSPTQFFDIAQQTSDLNFAFHADALPANYYQNLVKPDSVRVRRNIQRLEVADAWGECLIPGGQYTALRLKGTEYVNTSVDFKIGMFWLNINSVGGAGSGSPFFNLIGTDTLVTFHFIAEGVREEIAAASLNGGQNTVTALRFKDNSPLQVENMIPKEGNWLVFPNPASGRAWLDCSGLPPGGYLIAVFGANGQCCSRSETQIAGGEKVGIDLHGLPPGACLVCLFDGGGRWVKSQKLVIK